MLRKIIYAIILFIASFNVVLANELTILTYDSLLSEGGLGPFLKQGFEKKCNCKTRWISAPDAAQMLTKISRDREAKKEIIDVAIGIDQNLFQSLRGKVVPFENKWRPTRWENLNPQIKKSEWKDGFVPYNFGYFSFIADLENIKKLNLVLPTKINDLLSNDLRKKIIVQDPRTSTPGLAFLLWIEQVKKTGTELFWKSFSKQWMTLGPSWSGTYNLFLKEEAPLVWSYTTSQAYHEKQGQGKRFEAVLFEEGQPIQIEGAVILNKKNIENSKLFLDYLLSEEVQKNIPETNWMYPAIENTILPVSFKNLKNPSRVIFEPIESKEIERLIQKWKTAIRS